LRPQPEQQPQLSDAALKAFDAEPAVEHRARDEQLRLRGTPA
jgi:hypothetical protein